MKANARPSTTMTSLARISHKSVCWMEFFMSPQKRSLAAKLKQDRQYAHLEKRPSVGGIFSSSFETLSDCMITRAPTPSSAQVDSGHLQIRNHSAGRSPHHFPRNRNSSCLESHSDKTIVRRALFPHTNCFVARNERAWHKTSSWERFTPQFIEASKSDFFVFAANVAAIIKPFFIIPLHK